VNAEAVRQYGRLTVTVIDAAGDLVTVAWNGVSSVYGTAGTQVNASTGVLRDTGRKVVGDAKQATSTITNRARTAAATVQGNLSVVGDGVEDAAESVGDEGAAGARRVTKAADTGAAETFRAGANRPSGPYENWTKEELYERAQELDIDGRSGMSKNQLVKALRSA